MDTLTDEVLDQPMEILLEKARMAHLEHVTPAWWLRHVTRYQMADDQRRSPRFWTFPLALICWFLVFLTYMNKHAIIHHLTRFSTQILNGRDIAPVQVLTFVVSVISLTLLALMLVGTLHLIRDKILLSPSYPRWLATHILCPISSVWLTGKEFTMWLLNTLNPGYTPDPWNPQQKLNELMTRFRALEIQPRERHIRANESSIAEHRTEIAAMDQRHKEYLHAHTSAEQSGQRFIADQQLKCAQYEAQRIAVLQARVDHLAFYARTARQHLDALNALMTQYHDLQKIRTALLAADSISPQDVSDEEMRIVMRQTLAEVDNAIMCSENEPTYMRIDESPLTPDQAIETELARLAANELRRAGNSF